VGKAGLREGGEGISGGGDFRKTTGLRKGKVNREGAAVGETKSRPFSLTNIRGGEKLGEKIGGLEVARS